jgi:hypothetical protein
MTGKPGCAFPATQPHWVEGAAAEHSQSLPPARRHYVLVSCPREMQRAIRK